METKLLFGNAVEFATPMLAVLAVDLSAGKDAAPQPAMLSGSNAVQQALSGRARGKRHSNAMRSETGKPSSA